MRLGKMFQIPLAAKISVKRVRLAPAKPGKFGGADFFFHFRWTAAGESRRFMP